MVLATRCTCRRNPVMQDLSSLSYTQPNQSYIQINTSTVIWLVSPLQEMVFLSWSMLSYLSTVSTSAIIFRYSILVIVLGTMHLGLILGWRDGEDEFLLVDLDRLLYLLLLLLLYLLLLMLLCLLLLLLHCWNDIYLSINRLNYQLYSQIKYLYYPNRMIINLNSYIQIMKLDPILQKQIEWRFQKQKRKILFITRTKMFIQLTGSQWQQNCSGLLVFCQKQSSAYFTIINVLTFQINFDFQLYTNFISYSKFLGDQRCLVFLAPIHSRNLSIMLVLESKQELTEFKRLLDKYYAMNEGNLDQLDYLSRPEVIEILKKAQVDENVLAVDLTFREQVEKEIKKYFKQLNDKNQNKSKTGFKSYALGRDQWKLQTDQVNFLKEKLLISLTDTLGNYQKQARIRMNKK